MKLSKLLLALLTGSSMWLPRLRSTASRALPKHRSAPPYGIETSALVARDASVAVGTSVTVVAESTGYALIAAGRMIAFVPNEVGRALLHHSVR